MSVRLDRIETMLATRPEAASAAVSAMTDERDELLVRITALESLLDISMRDHGGKLTELATQLIARRCASPDWAEWLRTASAQTMVRASSLRIAFDSYMAKARQMYGTARQCAARFIALK